MREDIVLKISTVLGPGFEMSSFSSLVKNWAHSALIIAG